MNDKEVADVLRRAIAMSKEGHVTITLHGYSVGVWFGGSDGCGHQANGLPDELASLLDAGLDFIDAQRGKR